MDRDEREQAIEAVMRDARAVRPRTSRTLWIIAALIGVACAIGFVVMLLSDSSTTSGVKPVDTERGLGFSAGLLIGAVVGIVVGFAAARRVHAHSSRKIP